MLALGRHIIAELYHCEVEKIDDVTFVEKAMLEAAELAGATVINSTFHHFSPYGVSGVIVIEESHFSIHCWPEHAYASLDIYTCGDAVDPWIAYDHLKKEFGASDGSAVELSRGQSIMIDPAKKLPSAHGGKMKKEKRKIKTTRNVWFTQRNEHLALSLRHSGERLCMEKTPFQKIEVYDTAALGRMLVLDGQIVCAEKDEHAYHEMITHVPAFALPDPRHVLVIGGGDGGVCRELIRHDGIAKIDVVEIDIKVIDISKEYLPALAAGFDDQRVHIIVGDGFEFVKQTPANAYDIVIIDSELTNPEDETRTQQVYHDIYGILKDRGILIAQGGSPGYSATTFEMTFSQLKNVFGSSHTFCYLLFLPSYPSGMWSFAFAARGGVHPTAGIDKNSIDDFCLRNSLEYYSYDMHKSAFKLPPFVKNILL